MYCSKEDVELQIIESIFTSDPAEVAKFLGRKDGGAGIGTDVLTVCVAPCADTIRKASDVIVRDEVFGG
jgi:hypothetical protein